MELAEVRKIFLAKSSSTKACFTICWQSSKVPVTSNPDSESPFPWSLYRIGVVVTEPNGRRMRIETSRLSRP